MAHRLLVVAGDNQSLRALPDQLDDIEVKLIDSANDVLWEVRTAPPEVVIADANLSDMSGMELAEIIPSFDVATRVILWSREENPALSKRAESIDIYHLFQGDVAAQEIHEKIRAAVARAVEMREAALAAPPPPEPEPEPEPEPRATSGRTRLSSRANADRSGGGRSRPASPAPAPPREPEPAPPPPPMPPMPSQPGRRAMGNLVITADNLTPIRSIMSNLSQELGPQCILLTDRAGMVLVEVGSVDKLPTMILLPLLSTSFSTAGEVAHQLGEEEATTLYIHEGLNYDLYCFDIMQRFLLVLVFNKKVASSKIGAVWVNTKRAIRELQEAFG